MPFKNIYYLKHFYFFFYYLFFYCNIKFKRKKNEIVLKNSITYTNQNEIIIKNKIT